MRKDLPSGRKKSSAARESLTNPLLIAQMPSSTSGSKEPLSQKGSQLPTRLPGIPAEVDCCMVIGAFGDVAVPASCLADPGISATASDATEAHMASAPIALVFMEPFIFFPFEKKKPRDENSARTHPGSGRYNNQTHNA